MIQVTASIAIDDGEISEEFVRSSGPGGQNVNKVATAVVLRFDAAGSKSLPPYVKARILGSKDSRVTQNGQVVIFAQRFASQKQNREDAINRLIQLIRQAAAPVKKRIPTRPKAGAIKRRMEKKRLVSKKKSLRKKVVHGVD